MSPGTVISPEKGRGWQLPPGWRVEERVRATGKRARPTCSFNSWSVALFVPGHDGAAALAIDNALAAADLAADLGRHLVEDTPVWGEMDQASMDRWWEDVQRDRFWFWVNEVQDKHPDFKTDDR